MALQPGTQLGAHRDWDIGEMIVARQQGETWGRSIVQRLAADLRNEFPGIGGLSASNLWRMKLFYEAYAGNEKLAPLVREIGWTHNLIVPAELQGQLPSAEQIARLLEGIE